MCMRIFKLCLSNVASYSRKGGREGGGGGGREGLSMSNEGLFIMWCMDE